MNSFILVLYFTHWLCQGSAGTKYDGMQNLYVSKIEYWNVYTITQTKFEKLYYYPLRISKCYESVLKVKQEKYYIICNTANFSFSWQEPCLESATKS